MNKKLKLEELKRITVSEFKNSVKEPIVVVLDDVRSLNNIGSIFRTCDAMAVEKIYLCGITAQPPHREIRKTAIGATESMNWEYSADALNIVRKYKNLKYSTIAVEQTSASISLEKYHFKNDKIILIFGNEIEGVSQKLIDECDLSLEIPQYGTKHSINISVTTGMVLWTIKMNKLLKQPEM